MRIRRTLARIALVRFAVWAKVVWRERKRARRRPRAAAQYLLHGREFTNFTYELANLDEGVAFVATVLGAPSETSRAVLVTDEARATGVLAELNAPSGTQRIGEAGRYAAFREAPLRHFWPGNELGVAVFDDDGA